MTLDRIRRLDVEENYEVWKEYAYQAEIHPAIMAYLELRRDYFYRIETTVDGKVFATARGWEDLSEFLKACEVLKKRVDREVVHQYIQHWKIAKDFANYLELYYKYEKDYQVEAILDGRVLENIYTRLERAPFDERLSVMSLLLAGLNSGFRNLQEKRQRLERLEKIFRRLKPKGAKETDGAGADAGRTDAGRTEYDSPAEYLAGLAAGMQAERKYKLESGLLNRKEDHLYQDVIAVLERTLQAIKADSCQTEEEVWQKVSEIFETENQAYETLFDLCADRLEHTFDFMEAAFGSGQEMVVFVTGLNTGFYSVDFLQEYGCERYYEYNKMLLFDDREKEILKQMES